MNKAEENMFGGNDGKAWDDGSYKFVRKITVAYGQCIYSIRVVYDEKGAPVEKDEHGGGGSSITKRVSSMISYPPKNLFIPAWGLLLFILLQWQTHVVSSTRFLNLRPLSLQAVMGDFDL